MWVSNVHPSTKRFFDFNEIWYVDRGRWVTHDGMQYDPMRDQGQGHELHNIISTYINWFISIIPGLHTNCMPRYQDNYPTSFILNFEHRELFTDSKTDSLLAAIIMSSTHTSIITWESTSNLVYMQLSARDCSKPSAIRNSSNIVFQFLPLCFKLLQLQYKFPGTFTSSNKTFWLFSV